MKKTIKQQRRKLDQYFTPRALLNALRNHVLITGDVIEPCNGEGALSNQLKASLFVNNKMFTNDVDPALRIYNDTTEDATDPDAKFWNKRRYTWAVTNPPFSIAEALLRTAWMHSDNVALLLRLSFLEPTFSRAPLLKRLQPHLSHVLIFGSPRPSFTDNGRTDSVTTAWLVWQRELAAGTDVHFIDDWKSTLAKRAQDAP